MRIYCEKGVGVIVACVPYFCFRVEGVLPRRQRTSLVEDLYKEIIIRSPKNGRFFGGPGVQRDSRARGSRSWGWACAKSGAWRLETA